MKILSLLPRARFDECGIAFPQSLPSTFYTLKSTHTLLTAAESCQALLLPPSFAPSADMPKGFMIDRFCLERMPALRFIQTTGAGFDSVDHLTAGRMGIPVSNSPGMNASTVAEYVLSAIVTLQRGLLFADSTIRRTLADGSLPADTDVVAHARTPLLRQGGLELAGSLVGLVGLGHTSQALVPLLQAAGCRVMAFDVCWPETFAAQHGVQRASLGELFAQCDVVSLHCPLLENTRNMVDAAVLRTMKPAAILINAARGGLVVEKDLALALENDTLRGAALDCFAEAAPHPDLLRGKAAERTLLTPHLAGVSRLAFSRMISRALGNLERVLVRDEPPEFVINGVSENHLTAA